MSRFSGAGGPGALRSPRSPGDRRAGPRLAYRQTVKSRPHRLTSLSFLAPLMLAMAAAACGPVSSAAAPDCASGTICTWAGNGDPAFYGDGLDRREAMLYWPMDLAFAPDGRAYILDWQNHRVRRVGL